MVNSSVYYPSSRPHDSPSITYDSPDEARNFAKQMIGHSLVTKQTGEKGRVCNAVRIVVPSFHHIVLT